MILKKILFVFFMLLSVIIFSQNNYTDIAFENNKYPQNYFQNPIDIPLVLAATFGELRTNHFHAGIDIKTQKKQGLPILTVADGYVSRIKIQHWGYGKVVYVTHPNGYTSVYAHLQKFNDKLEAYIKKRQYQKKSYEIQLFPKANVLKLTKGETLAYSGNTGGSSAPHLHFEIRDANTGKTINPLLFGIHVNDNTKPVIQSVYAYPLDDFTVINNVNKMQKITFTKQENGNLLADALYAKGTVGLGIKSFDRLDDANNKNGLYKVEMFVNKQKVYQHKLETFSFSEGKYVNLLMDYKHKFYKHEKIQKCFVVPNNKLSIYNNVINNGELFIQNGQKYNVEIITSDIKGNTTKLIIPIIGKTQEPNINPSLAATNLELIATKNTKLFKRNQFNEINKNNVSVKFPTYCFYNDIDFEFSYKNGLAKIHNGSVPLNKNFTLSFNIANYPINERKQLFIARVSKKGHLSYVNTKRKENKIYTNTKKLGNYKIASDVTKPTITAINFKDGQWLTNFKTLKVRVKDNLTGIKKYTATIDGQWILMEYEPKKGTLTYNLNDQKFTTAKHTLKIIVSDEVNNTKTYIATFYRKK